MDGLDMGMTMPTAVASSITPSGMVQATSTAAETVATALGTMSMGGGNGCKLSMLLNWHTIDACFLSSIFHIRSSFTFFLACLGAFTLVVSLEFVRRIQRQFDQYLQKRNNFFRTKQYVLPAEMEEKLLDPGDDHGFKDEPKQKAMVVILDQLLRGLIHVVQFSISYCIMLLFMYSNGFIIISILVGALVGFALFTRDTLYPSRDFVQLDGADKSCC
ncbi:uncharacterized protein L3040_000308 [Drepanopeziza brunnea f. sp. 'multigermtubi']|uniref:Copper transport protein n=1 Tax=Marssonina brunnea f. sp. multigermtubi (strain MB_m1) TaxID=1072389 RepID=K1WJ59_MARBU|nr:high affinity copper transporter [Drepanopeziza brunnea f. sp. 'multigermtubi' MB_m1]EKD12222.1 high affinity copper transporter [Drepanopeziza brunnea f. sp. 'multigermtubi' MB_m1]KAJ5054022.1 hypothetical protein L3040_000308 [Drepanopeziza brunnea f. sp. 'multigermtubi']